jgi:hypothetical protein
MVMDLDEYHADLARQEKQRQDRRVRLASLLAEQAIVDRLTVEEIEEIRSALAAGWLDYWYHAMIAEALITTYDRGDYQPRGTL